MESAIFFPIKPWKWPRGKNEGNKGGRRGGIGENKGEKFGICHFFPHQAFEMTKGENKGKKGGRMSGIAENEGEKIWNFTTSL